MVLIKGILGARNLSSNDIKPSSLFKLVGKVKPFEKQLNGIFPLTTILKIYLQHFWMETAETKKKTFSWIRTFLL